MRCTVDQLRTICLWPTGIQDFPTSSFDEVYPNILIGDADSASNIQALRHHNVSHVLNASHGTDIALNTMEIYPAEVYHQAGIEFLGIPAIDMSSYPIYRHFEDSTEFIRKALSSGGKVLVHCRMGISRSATLVLAYLVMDRGMNLQEAARAVRQRREILPNPGFMHQLCELNERYSSQF